MNKKGNLFEKFDGWMRLIIQEIKKNIKKLLILQIISKYYLRFTIIWKISTKIPINLIIGAGGTEYPNWISTDKFLLDITRHQEWDFYFKQGSIDRILAEHLFEHLTADDLNKALKCILFFLKPDGFLRIAVPDGYFPDPDYINQVKPGGYGSGSEDHKFLYTYDHLGRLLIDCGFNHSFLEYYDENGIFHFNEWNPDDGMVVRSVRFDERNKAGEIKYTSIIVDANKKENRKLGIALQKEKMAIIFEDYLICMHGTYNYLCAALEHYREDTRLMSVTGRTHPLVTPKDITDQPCFDGRAECWVWGTWGRAWDGMTDYDAFSLMKMCEEREIIHAEMVIS